MNSIFQKIWIGSEAQYEQPKEAEYKLSNEMEGTLCHFQS